MFNLTFKQSQNQLAQFNWLHWGKNSLIIIVAFALLELVLYRFSIHFSLYDGWVSWYFPVGLRAVSFFLLPFKYWPALYLGTQWGSGIYFLLFWKPEWLTNFDGNYISYLLNRTLRIFDPINVQKWSILIIALLKIKLKQIDFTKLVGFIYILMGCALYRAVSSTKLILMPDGSLYQNIPEIRRFEMLFGHFLGGFVGITTMMLAMFLCVKCWQLKHQINIAQLARFLGQLATLVTVIILVFHLQPHTLYLMRIFAIIPLVYFLVKFGWLGITTCALTFNILLFIHLFGVNQTDILVENQIYVISYALTALLLGALFEEQKSSQQALQHTNAKLTQSNHELAALSNKVQLLAQQLVSTQEKERQFLSQELHDEVGQNVSALKTELKVLEKRLAKQNVTLSTEQLDTVSDHIYDSVYSVLNWLRPRVLDDMGLYQCLTGNYFSKRLEKAGIEYQATIDQSVNQLNDDLKIAIFRITQEAITNTVRYANAQRFIVRCSINQADITLALIDDGKGFNSSSAKPQGGGFGLSGIEDRVTALGGKMTLLSMPKQGTKITVTWPLANDSNND